MIILKLEVTESYALGDEMEIQLAVLNSADAPIDINSFIDTSRALKTNIFSIVGPDGTKIAYHGMRTKGADRSIQLLPHENRLFKVMLAKEYYLSMNGTYTINLIPSNILLDNSQWETSTEVTRLIVTTDDDYTLPAVTRAQEETLHMKSARSKCEHIGKNNKVCGASDKQKLSLKDAHDALILSLSYISAQDSTVLPVELKPSHEEVFCASDASSWPALHGNYSAMLTYAENGVTYRFNGTYCSPQTYGYVFSGHTRDVFLCGLYDAALVYPTAVQLYDTKLGVIAHEISHKAVNSDDHFYGHDRCKREAAICNISVTSTNADCLQFFAEFAYIKAVSDIDVAGKDGDEL